MRRRAAMTSIKVYRDLMGENDAWARRTRELLAERNVRLFNLIGSPGSGKTAVLERMAERRPGRCRFAVLEGDVETTRDAERMAARDIPVSQLLTGGACHLEAKLVHAALREMPLDGIRIVFVENVGNLVCPAEFDIGETAKIAVLSVTEGEDKPAKYPLLFREARAVLLTKTDLLPHLSFDADECERFVQSVHPGMPVWRISARDGSGFDEWERWLQI